jgi:hypothetical protein
MAQRQEKISSFPSCFELDILLYLETGNRLHPDIIWLNDNGDEVNLLEEMLKISDPDPWMDEPWTEEEKKCFENIDCEEGEDF